MKGSDSYRRGALRYEVERWREAVDILAQSLAARACSESSTNGGGGVSPSSISRPGGGFWVWWVARFSELGNRVTVVCFTAPHFSHTRSRMSSEFSSWTVVRTFICVHSQVVEELEGTEDSLWLTATAAAPTERRMSLTCCLVKAFLDLE